MKGGIELMCSKEIFAFNYGNQEFCVDRYKILYILSKLSNCNVCKFSKQNIIDLIIEHKLLDKKLFYRINKM